MNLPGNVSVTWEEFLRQALVYRILDDARYTEKRLGRVPSEEEVNEAISPILSHIVDEMAQALDSHEADVWRRLGDE